MPALQRAQAAVASIQAKDITEMKTNRNPAEVIKYVMDVVMIYFGDKVQPITIVEKTLYKKENIVKLFLDDSFE